MAMYPDLTKAARSFYSIFRQGGIFLICLVAFGASQKSHGRTIGTMVNHIPETSVSRLVASLPESKRISITDFTKDIDSFAAVFKTRELVWPQTSWNPPDYSKVSGRTQVRIAGGASDLICYRLFDKGEWQNLCADPLGQSVGRSLTPIYGPHRDNNFGIRLENRMILVTQIGENISPQLSTRSADHNDKDKGLNESANDSRARENDHPPIGRRLITMIGGIGGGILLALNGPDDDRTLLRAACIGGGCILIGGGLGLWWATLFPASWGWPL
jgi:hypothetical protein